MRQSLNKITMILMLSIGLLFSCSSEWGTKINLPDVPTTQNDPIVQIVPVTPEKQDNENCKVLGRFDYENFFIVFTRGCFGKGKMCQHLNYVQVQFDPEHANAASLRVAQLMYMRYGDKTELKPVYDYREYDDNEKMKFIRIVYRIKTKMENMI